MKNINYTFLMRMEIGLGLLVLPIYLYLIVINAVLALIFMPFMVMGVLIVFASQHRLRSYEEHKYIVAELEDIHKRLDYQIKLIKGLKK